MNFMNTKFSFVLGNAFKVLQVWMQKELNPQLMTTFSATLTCNYTQAPSPMTLQIKQKYFVPHINNIKWLSSLQSIHCGWRRLPLQRWKLVLLWLRRPMRDEHCLPQSGHWWTESWIGQSTGVCWYLRLRLRAAARSYSSSKHDIPKEQVDLQIALLDAGVSSLLRGM